MVGLGLKKICLINQAMISKQYWRIQNSPTSLLAKTFKAKYFPRSSFQDYKPKSHHSWIWKNVTTPQFSSLHHGQWLIGNGHQIPLTHPSWFHCPNHILMENRLPEGTVDDLIDANTKSYKYDLVQKLYPYPICMEIFQSQKLMASLIESYGSIHLQENTKLVQPTLYFTKTTTPLTC